MKQWWNELDRILRGEATDLGVLSDGSLKIPHGGLLLLMLLMAVLYGVCMGFFAGFREGGPFFMQWFAGIVKVPSLLFLTVAVTFPSLYVFNALVGSRLSFAALFQLLVAALAVYVAVLASLGPIVAFFSVSTTSYPFVLLLNVVVFVVSGVLGFAFMLQTLYRLSAARQALLPPLPPPSVPDGGESSEGREPPLGGSEERSAPDKAQLAEQPGALWGIGHFALERRVRNVFLCWIVVFGLVNSQMAWVLRPLLGKPSEPFQWFSPRESNFVWALWDAFRALLS
jgi:hypothetical protein